MLNDTKISSMMVRCMFMPNEEVLPELHEVLEKDFSELKIGEEKFQQSSMNDKPTSQDSKKIVYQQRYSSTDHIENIVVKPIKATKKTHTTGIEVDETTETKLPIESQKSDKNAVVKSPTSTIGDDFAVDW